MAEVNQVTKYEFRTEEIDTSVPLGTDGFFHTIQWSYLLFYEKKTEKAVVQAAPTLVGGGGGRNVITLQFPFTLHTTYQITYSWDVP